MKLNWWVSEYFCQEDLQDIFLCEKVLFFHIYSSCCIIIKEYLLEEIHYYRNVRINCVCVCVCISSMDKKFAPYFCLINWNLLHQTYFLQVTPHTPKTTQNKCFLLPIFRAGELWNVPWHWHMLLLFCRLENGAVIFFSHRSKHYWLWSINPYSGKIELICHFHHQEQTQCF